MKDVECRVTEKLFPRQRSLGGCVCDMCASVEYRGNHCLPSCSFCCSDQMPGNKVM